MKKALLVISILGSMFASADTDSYLYWMINNDTGKTYDTAKIRLVNDTTDTFLTIYNGAFGEIGESVTKAQVDTAAALDLGLYAAVDSHNLPASFVVELFNSGNLLGQKVIDSASVAEYLYAGGMSLPSASPIAFSGFVIPEPNSGVLMLLGFAVLGLRRRSRKNA